MIVYEGVWDIAEVNGWDNHILVSLAILAVRFPIGEPFAGKSALVTLD